MVLLIFQNIGVENTLLSLLWSHCPRCCKSPGMTNAHTGEVIEIVCLPVIANFGSRSLIEVPADTMFCPDCKTPTRNLQSLVYYAVGYLHSL